MSDPADLINRAVEALLAAATDLMTFSTLDRLMNRPRTEVHGRMYDRLAQRLKPDQAAALDALLAKPPGGATTGSNRLKQAPGPATPKTVGLWIDRLEWLGGQIEHDQFLEGITHTKLRQFAAEAAALDVGDLLDIVQPGRRHTLLLALLRQTRMRCRDELVEMMLRRIRLGLTGLADALAMVGERYGSPEVAQVAEGWASIVKRVAYLALTELAAEKGALPMLNRDAFLAGQTVRELDEAVRSAITEHGVRNALLTSIAPTGTISLFVDNVSSGVEPVFAHSFTRKVTNRTDRSGTSSSRTTRCGCSARGPAPMLRRRSTS